MPFWKKSEDPWDMEPGKASPAAEETENQEGLLDVLKSWSGQRDARKKAEEQPPMVCPWCGKEMELGYLCASQGLVCWRSGAHRMLSFGEELVVSDEGTFNSYKTTWRCRDCKKLILDAPEPPRCSRPQWDKAPEEGQED